MTESSSEQLFMRYEDFILFLRIKIIINLQIFLKIRSVWNFSFVDCNTEYYNWNWITILTFTLRSLFSPIHRTRNLSFLNIFTFLL